MVLEAIAFVPQLNIRQPAQFFLGQSVLQCESDADGLGSEELGIRGQGLAGKLQKKGGCHKWRFPELGVPGDP